MCTVYATVGKICSQKKKKKKQRPTNKLHKRIPLHECSVPFLLPYYPFRTGTPIVAREISRKKAFAKLLRLNVTFPLVSGNPTLHKHTYFPRLTSQMASSSVPTPLTPTYLIWKGLFFFKCINRYTGRCVPLCIWRISKVSKAQSAS